MKNCLNCGRDTKQKYCNTCLEVTSNDNEVVEIDSDNYDEESNADVNAGSYSDHGFQIKTHDELFNV